jgi:hypothetical protein
MEKVPWEPIESEEAMEWISSVLTPLPKYKRRGPGNPLSCLLPMSYPCYVKIFHSIWEEVESTNRQLLWDHAALTESSEIDDLTTLPSFLPNGLQTANEALLRSRCRRVMWKELCERYGVVYHAELVDPVRAMKSRSPWPRVLIGAAEGSLDDLEFKSMLTGLRGVTGSQSVYFYWDMLKTLHIDVEGEPICLRGDLQTPPSNWPAGLDWSPTYIWPDDRSWIVATDYDLSFTVVACNSLLRAELFKQNELECIDMKPDARIDNGSDRINR